MFAIKSRLTTLLHVDKDKDNNNDKDKDKDGHWAPLESESLATSSNGSNEETTRVPPTKTKDGCKDAAVVGEEPNHNDDSYTAAISESSSSFSSRIGTMFETPTNAVNDRCSLGGETREALSFPVAADDVKDDPLPTTTIGDTIAPTTTPSTEANNEDKNKNDIRLQEKIPSSLPMIGDKAREIPRPTETKRNDICGVTVNTGKQALIVNHNEALTDQGGAKVPSHKGQKQNVHAEKDPMENHNEAESRVPKEESEEKATRGVVDTMDSSGASTTTDSDVETVRKTSSKSEEEDNPSIESPNKTTRDAIGCPLKADTESKVAIDEDKLQQKFIQHDCTLEIRAKDTASRTKLERQYQNVEGLGGTRLSVVIETAKELLEKDKREEIAPKTIDSAKYSTDTATSTECTAGRKDTKPRGNIDAMPKQRSDKSSLTLAQRMKEMFDSSSPDQPSNAFGKCTERSSATLSAGKQGTKTDSQGPASVAKNMKAMLDSSLDERSNAFGKTTMRSSVSVPGNEENLSSTDSAQDMKAIFYFPSPDEASKAFRISTEKVERVPSKSVSLAKEMKAMFDSVSPDEPSKAFGLVKEDGEAMKPVSLTRNMKAMFDSPSPDVPSRAFGTDQGHGSKPDSLVRDMKTMFDSPSPDVPFRAFGIANRESKKSHIAAMKPRCTTDVVPMEQRIAEANPTKSKSPVSVADQMVSLLWASSTPIQQAPAMKDTSFRGMDHMVIRDTVIEDEEDENIEEIAVEDEDGDDCATIAHTCNDDDFEEIIEEIIIDGEHSNDDGGVSTETKFFEETAPVEVSVDVVVDCDDRSYDEITANDSEYEEETVGDDDAIDLREEQTNDIESKEWVEEMSKSKVDECTTSVETIDHSSADFSCDEFKKLLIHSTDDTNQKLVDETKENDNLECRDKESYATTSVVVRNAATNRIQMKLSPTTSHTDNCSFDSSRVQKLNPQLSGNRAATGTIVEKLKMFDSSKESSDQSQMNKIKQSLRKPKPLIESSSSKGIERAHVNEDIQKVNQLNSELSFTYKRCEEDEALVDEISSLVKEPGSMFNKRLLSERITSLLTGKKIEVTNVVAVKPSLHKAAQNIRQHSSPKSSYPSEANTYLDRKQGGFKHNGLKQMQKNVEMRGGKLNHRNDSDTIPNLTEKRIDSNDRKEEMTKDALAVDKKEESGVQTTPKSSFDKSPKFADAEEIIARIWPKTPDGEGKREPKSFSSSSRTLKTVAFESPRKTPSKLGAKLKMFQAPYTSPVASPPTKPSGTLHYKSIDLPQKASGKKDCDKSNQMTTTAIETVSGMNDSSNAQIFKKTAEIILSFPVSEATTATSLSHNSTENTHTSGTKEGIEINASLPTLSYEAEIPNTNPLPLTDTKPSTNSRSTNGRDASDEGDCYSLEDLEQGRFDPNITDMGRWEVFLTNESFHKHFGLTKHEFYKQPKWKRDKQKRKVRVAF